MFCFDMLFGGIHLLQKKRITKTNSIFFWFYFSFFAFTCLFKMSEYAININHGYFLATFTHFYVNFKNSDGKFNISEVFFQDFFTSIKYIFSESSKILKFF